MYVGPSAICWMKVGMENVLSKRMSTLIFSEIFPCLVVMMMTPLAPREPYSEVAVASFSTENDAIDSGGMLFIIVALISTPSRMMSGAVLEPKVDTPRM